MKTGGGVIEAVRGYRGLALQRTVDVPAAMWTRGRGRTPPSALTIILVVALLGIGVALVGLAAVTTRISRVPAATVAVDAEAGEQRSIYEPGDLGGPEAMLVPAFTR